VNVEAVDVPPHVTVVDGMHPVGAGLFTVTGGIPTVAMSAAEMAAVSPFTDANVVVRAAPFHRTVEQGNIPVPITDSPKAEPPAAALLGISCVMAGTGKDAGALKLKLAAAEIDAEFDTVMLTEPGNAMSAYVIAACSSVALTNVVGRGEPFQFTTVSLVKVVPLMVEVAITEVTSSVKPAGAQYGVDAICVVDAESVPMLSAETVKETAEEVPPPGTGVTTVTGTFPADARSAGRIGALSCVGLIYVVVLGDPFH
jgi:hypothetical protein